MPDLTDEQEIFAATETTEEAPAAAEPSEAPSAQPEPEGQPAAPVAGEVDPQPNAQPEQPQGHVPYAALKEEREARKALQARVDELTSLILRGPQNQQPPQAKEPEQEPDIFEDPSGFFQRQAAPIQTELQRTREFYSQREAIREHGKEAVETAYAALDAAIRRGEVDGNAIKSQLSQSLDPFGDIMAWHQRTSILSEVGTDPKAYEERLRAKILAELEQKQAPAGQEPAGAPSQPSTPTQPLPSLNRSFGNAGNPQGGAITEEDIFNAAPAFGRRKA